MAHFTTCLLRPLLWLRRFRHRCGYGIHSPYAFSFVTDVIYRPGHFYADPLIARLHAAARRPRIRLKDCHLLFRLANAAHPRICLLAGIEPRSLEGRCLRLGCQSGHYTCRPQQADMIVCGADWPEYVAQLLPLLSDGAMLVLTDIGSDKKRRRLWRKLMDEPPCVVSFDLWHYGLIVNRTDLKRQHYVINYY